jgi:hypothetical protein
VTSLPRRGLDQTMPPPENSAAHPAAARGFMSTFGLDPRVALLTVMVDLMANSATIVSAGLLYEVELGAAVVLTLIAYKAQRAWYGDDRDSALIKALIVGLLTAIPVPITPLFALPGGAIGLLRLFRRGGS